MSDSIKAVISKLEGNLTEEDYLVEVGKVQERIRILDILLHTLDLEDYQKVREAIK